MIRRRSSMRPIPSAMFRAKPSSSFIAMALAMTCVMFAENAFGSARVGNAEVPTDLLGEYSDELIESARDAVRTAPGDTTALATLGKYLTRKYNVSVEPALRAEADSVLKKALAASPNNAEALAFQGMLICIDAREKESQPLGKEGLAILDRAAEMDPSNLTVVYTNATVSIEVPKRWGRLDAAAEKMHAVEAKLNEDPGRARDFDIGIQNVYYKLGKVYQERRNFDKAVSYWKMAVEAGPGSAYGRRAKRLIERYGGPDTSATLWEPGTER